MTPRPRGVPAQPPEALPTCNAQTKRAGQHWVCDLPLGHTFKGQEEHETYSGGERVQWKDEAW